MLMKNLLADFPRRNYILDLKTIQRDWFNNYISAKYNMPALVLFLTLHEVVKLSTIWTNIGIFNMLQAKLTSKKYFIILGNIQLSLTGKFCL